MPAKYLQHDGRTIRTPVCITADAQMELEWEVEELTADILAAVRDREHGRAHELAKRLVTELETMI